jgi:hypothetical protein
MARSCLHIGELTMASGIFLGAVAAAWGQQGPVAIGEITVSRQAVTVTHGGAATALPMRARHAVVLADTLETGGGARVQALFLDDTMLTLGQHTRAQISEYLHDPAQQVRRMTVLLAQGSVRALVGRVYSGLGSTFVIQAGTVSVIADAGYCIVWRTDKETGVVNIGTSGPVSFVAEGRVVILAPGFYAVARAGQPPSAAEPVKAKASATVQRVVAETEVGDQIGVSADQLAEQAIEEELPACPPGSPPGGICPRPTPPAALSPATPPAVTSGAKPR